MLTESVYRDAMEIVRRKPVCLTDICRPGDTALTLVFLQLLRDGQVERYQGDDKVWVRVRERKLIQVR